VPDEGHPKETRQNRLETGIDGERRRDWTVTRTHIVRGDREDRVEEGRVGREETRREGDGGASAWSPEPGTVGGERRPMDLEREPKAETRHEQESECGGREGRGRVSG